jgi:hypothetical protein
VGADFVVGRYDGQIGFRLPVQRKVEVAREAEPSSGSTMWLSEWDLIFMA